MCDGNGFVVERAGEYERYSHVIGTSRKEHNENTVIVA